MSGDATAVGEAGFMTGIALAGKVKSTAIARNRTARHNFIIVILHLFPTASVYLTRS
jgi:hypothetical protein